MDGGTNDYGKGGREVCVSQMNLLGISKMCSKARRTNEFETLFQEDLAAQRTTVCILLTDFI